MYHEFIKRPLYLHLLTTTGLPGINLTIGTGVPQGRHPMIPKSYYIASPTTINIPNYINIPHSKLALNMLRSSKFALAD